MTIRHVLTLGLVLCFLAIPAPGRAAEKECDRWLKLVDGEMRERKEALGKRSAVDRERIQKELTRVGPQVVEARKACSAGNDKGATLMALDLWDALVESERQEGTLSLNSRLNILALRIDRLKAFHQRGWRSKMTDEAQRAFLAEIDKFDRILADVLKQPLR
jgi:hypothetical protein